MTGGEPLLQREIGALTRGLRAAELHVTVETAGTVAPDFACDLLEGFFKMVPDARKVLEALRTAR